MYFILKITAFSVRNYLCYLLDSFIAVFLENSENDSKLKYWINLAFTGKIYFCILGLGLGIDTSGLVYIPAYCLTIRTRRLPTAAACPVQHLLFYVIVANTML